MTDTQDALDFFNSDAPASEWAAYDPGTGGAYEPAPWEQELTHHASALEEIVLPMLATTQVADADIVRKVRDVLGRKLEAADLQDGGEGGKVLYEIACRWLPTQENADFEYTRDLARKFKAGGGLTDRQAVGVLNSYYNALTKPAPRQPQPIIGRDPNLTADADDKAYDAWTAFVMSQISKGRYTIARPGKHRTFQLSEWRKDGRDPGKQVRYVNVRIGPGESADDWPLCAVQEMDGSFKTVRDYKGDGSIKEDLAILFDLNPEVRHMMREAYALESGRCARCGRELTVPASIHRGLGPDCAGLVSY